jgi:hypothetical protein
MGANNPATNAALNATWNTHIQGSVYTTNYFGIAWKLALNKAVNDFPEDRAVIDIMNTRVQQIAAELPANPAGLHEFMKQVGRELSNALGQRAQGAFNVFCEQVQYVQRLAAGHQQGHQAGMQDLAASFQPPVQGQQQPLYTAEQIAQQQQQAAYANRLSQQQQPQQQQQQPQQPMMPQQGQAPLIQPLFRGATTMATPHAAATTAGMYQNQPQGMIVNNPLATAAPGVNPQMMGYPPQGAGQPQTTFAQQQAATQRAQQQNLANQGQLRTGSPAAPPAGATNLAAQAGKPPKAPKAAAKRAAESDAGAGGTGAAAGDVDKPAPKRAKAAAAPRKKKGQDSDADDDAADKIKVGDELLVDLQAETDAAMEGIASRRHRQLHTVPGGQSWDEGYQYLSAWRLTNEVLQQRREKMPGAAALIGPAGVVDFLEPSTLRALQLGFTAHASEVMRRAAHAAKHRATSAAAQRRPEFVASGDDARRGLGDIRRAAEKIAADKAAVEREELMKKAQSKRADEETRERAQKARAEMAGQQQASAANKAIAATLGGGKGAKWSKWSGAGAAAGAKGKGKGAKGDATDAGDGDAAKNLASSRSRGDLGTAGGSGAAGAGTSAADALESTDIQLQDLIVALQQDSTYCKSMLLYRLLNGMN